MRGSGEQGILSVKNAAVLRRKLQDVKNREVIDRVESVMDSKDVVLKWKIFFFSSIFIF